MTSCSTSCSTLPSITSCSTSCSLRRSSARSHLRDVVLDLVREEVVARPVVFNFVLEVAVGGDGTLARRGRLLRELAILTCLDTRWGRLQVATRYRYGLP